MQWKVPTVGISREVMEHLAQLHACGPDVDGIETPCPCGITDVIFCSQCGLPVFFLVSPGEWCEHAERLWNGQ